VLILRSARHAFLTLPWVSSAGKTDTIAAAILPYVVASDTKLVDGKVVGDPTEGALLVLAYKAGVYIDATREQVPRLATLPFVSSYKLMATFNQAKNAAVALGFDQEVMAPVVALCGARRSARDRGRRSAA
jgi:magnesium-transporting ATPase (P-type)